MIEKTFNKNRAFIRCGSAPARRFMMTFKKVFTTWAIAAAALVALGVTSAPASANRPMSGSEKLRRLDVMLMVTSLRCRTTADNFNVEYGRFTNSHMADLNRANADLRGELATRFGAAGANRQLDRLSTVMANTYGQGHPWLSCRELKSVAGQLANLRGQATLEEAADELLSDRAPALAYARR
jgi:hypothetical protein